MRAGKCEDGAHRTAPQDRPRASRENPWDDAREALALT